MNLDRRAFLNACSSAGITSALLPGVLYTLAVQAQEIYADLSRARAAQDHSGDA